jgi:hypothetical protein
VGAEATLADKLADAASSASRWQVGWRRLARRSFIGGLIALTAVVLWKRALGPQFGFDFYGGAWKAGHALLHGSSPYVQPDPRLLFSLRNAFVTPPLLGILAIPFALLPFKVAAALWAVLCAVAFVAALRLLGVRDTRLYALAICSFPFVDSVLMGQSDCLLVLLAALAWRYRDSSRGGAAAGALVAAKLFAWPLLIWLLATRRFRAAGLALASGIGLTLASWAVIDFHGMTAYPKLLAADARAFEGWAYSNSVVGGAMHFGASAPLASALAIAFAVAVAAVVVSLARGSDEGWFGAAIGLGLFASPVVWPHYLVLLFVPIAISRTRSVRPWAVASLLWIGLFDVPPDPRTITIITAATCVVFWSAYEARTRLRTSSGCVL